MWTHILTETENKLLSEHFWTMCICHFSYGESIIPNKVLAKPDSYQGHWKDGKIHGFGKYKSVHSLLPIFV